MENQNIANLRKDYTLQSLDITDVLPDPVDQFQAWFKQALDSELPEPNAMHLSTVNSEGHPSARIVLLKGIQDKQLVFYSNYDSDKGRQMVAHPHVALTFFWAELERQVRMEGPVEKVAPEVSDEYFQSRPRASRIGAWVSLQSSTISGRSELEQRQAEFTEKFHDAEVPRPPHWGGFRLKPERIEFWQGRPSRLHDRILYTRHPNDSWKTERLAP